MCLLGVGKGVPRKMPLPIHYNGEMCGGHGGNDVALPCLVYPKEGTRKSLIKDVILTVEENMAQLLEKRDRRIQEMEEKMQKQDRRKLSGASEDKPPKV